MKKASAAAFIHKIFKTNFNFHVKQCSTDSFSIFKENFSSTEKNFFLRGEYTLGNNSMKF